MLGNLHPLVQLSVLNQMESKPKLTILDTMNFWMDNTLEDLLEVIEKVDVITINDEEQGNLLVNTLLEKQPKKFIQWDLSML